MNTSNPRGSRLALLSLLCFGLSACAACGPGALPGEESGTGGASLAQRDGGIMQCAPGEICDEYPGSGGSGPFASSHPDINGGFESIDAAGVPAKWSTSCTWNGLVLITVNAASAGSQGLRMFGGCTVSSARPSIPLLSTRAVLSFKSRTATTGAASVAVWWYDSSGAGVLGGTTTIQGSSDRTFFGNGFTSNRPSNAVSAAVVISTPSTSIVTADFDEVSLDFI